MEHQGRSSNVVDIDHISSLLESCCNASQLKLQTILYILFIVNPQISSSVIYKDLTLLHSFDLTLWTDISGYAWTQLQHFIHIYLLFENSLYCTFSGTRNELHCFKLLLFRTP